MNSDDLERLLAESFDRQARASVGEGSIPPRPRFLDETTTRPRGLRTARLLAPLAAAAAVIAVVVGVVVVQQGSRPTAKGTVANPVLSTKPAPSTSAPSTSAPTVPVHVSLANVDGSTVGVGMPIVAFFSKPITNAVALSEATALTVNGESKSGAWFFERSNRAGYPLEAHFRMASYWPGNAKITLQLPIKGLSAGRDYAYDDDLALSFLTGPAQIVKVYDSTHQLVVERDGRPVERARVSLGTPATPTMRGTKVIMAKAPDIAMKGPGYYEPHVEWTQQLTYSGEYLNAAKWNEANIVQGVDSSNGCTDLMPDDAKKLYSMLRVGDVVEYPDATGPTMSLAQGYGDWNVPWPVWLTGGAVPTS